MRRTRVWSVRPEVPVSIRAMAEGITTKSISSHECLRIGSANPIVFFSSPIFQRYYFSICCGIWRKHVTASQVSVR